MNHLSDEILNRYIDNELSASEINEVNSHIKICKDCLNKLKAIGLVDSTLKKLQPDFAPSDFSDKVMEKIFNKRQARSEKNYLFRVVFSLIVSLVFTALLIVFMNFPYYADSEINTRFEKFKGFLHGIVLLQNSLLCERNISIIGFSLTVIVFISAYFMFESHKKIKQQIDKLSKI